MATRLSEPVSADAPAPSDARPDIRHDWTRVEAEALFALPFNDLLYRAHTLHRRYFDPNEVQLSTLLNIKDGGCPEDCKYCAQSARYDTGFPAKKLMDKEKVLEAARAAKAAGAQRFCMGAAWRSPKGRELERVCEIVREVKGLGLETCATLGMLDRQQAEKLRQSGLDYYNHNLDTSADFYPEVVTTRTYSERLKTLENIREIGLKTCCGGILGLGESEADRAALLVTLANLPRHPESVPINLLVAIEGTPYAGNDRVDAIDFVRVIATARVMMPASVIRFAAGRLEMDESCQALAFFAGANSIFYGEKLLTTPNPVAAEDKALFDRLGLRPMGTSG